MSKHLPVRVVAPLIGATLLLLIALFNGLRPIPASSWPWLYDALRDVGMAQVILEGRYPADNLYPDEVLWFNPLTGALIALASFATGADAPTASVWLGPFINLFPAIMFCILASSLLGAWPGIAALAVYLFWNAQSPAYAYATYTPWLFAPHLAIGFFCASLLCFVRARSSSSLPWLVGAGLLHGLTFITHTAPAVILGCVFVGTTLMDLNGAPQRPERRRAVRNLGLLLGIAFVSSLPYTLPILLAYGFEIRNSFPGANMQSPVQLHELPSRAWGSLNLANLFAVAGLWIILRTPGPTRVVILVWTVITASFMGWVYIGQVWPSLWPGVSPGHHFHSALTLLRCILAGAGAYTLLDALMTRGTRQQDGHGEVGQLRNGIAACTLITLTAFPAYFGWEEFTQDSTARSPYGTQVGAQREIYNWLLANTTPDETILCDDLTAMVVAAPAARGVVSTMLIFSSPYIDATRRIADRDQLFALLRAKDRDAFVQLAGEYKVAYLLVAGDETRIVDVCDFEFIQPVMQSGQWHLYRLEANAPLESPGQQSRTPVGHGS